MKSSTGKTFITALLVMVAICACPRRKPEIGLRPDDRSEHLDTYMAIELDPQRDSWQKPEMVIETADIEKGAQVGVAYAGGGYFVEKLSEAVGPEGVVYASEPDGEIIEILRQRVEAAGLQNVKFIEARAEDPQFPYATLDAAFVVDAQPYIDLPYAFFDNMRRGMKPDGKIVVIDWKRGASLPRLEKGRLRHKRETKDMLDGMDLEFVDEYDFLPQQYFLLYKVVKRYGDAGVECRI